MKRVRPVSSTEASSNPPLSQRLVWWLVMLVALPLVLFAWWAYLQFPSRLAQLSRIERVEVWHEDLGNPVFRQDTLSALVRTPPDWSKAQWQAVALPHFKELGASIDLPPDAPKRRVWVRVQIPEHDPGQGRLGLLGFRVQGGPWALWEDGKLQQANLSDWRIQWNVPVRLAVPLGAREVMLAVPYAEPQGFSVGSILVGPMDRVESAWQERNLLHLELPRFMAVVALLLALMSFQLARARPQEPIFRLLGVIALVWTVSSIQFAFDTTGQDTLSVWFGSVVDSSITWTVVLGILFALDYEKVPGTRFRVIVVGYAALSTVLTLPVWDWQKNALMAQQYLNVVAFLWGLGLLGLHVVRHPRREGWALFISLALMVALGVHTLENLTNQTNPDSFYSFSLGTLLLYLAFTYVMGRRTVAALEASERHEQVLQDRLDEQEKHLAEQHALLQRLEVERRLLGQHETIMQDLHDRLGSNLTSALLQARAGGLSSQETVLLLQDLADELRHIGKSTTQDVRSLNQVLAELRQRVQHRLGHGGIALDWDVDPELPPMTDRETGQHVRALLSEAIANVIKHAGATRIRVSARQDGGQVVIEVSDNGAGFVPENVELGRGLPGMQQRASALGGALSIESAPGQGCRWRLVLTVTDG
jgi:signal transduction histidine kinase